MAELTLTTTDDSLIGTDGNDAFSGASGGIDTLTGGGGQDRFTLTAAFAGQIDGGDGQDSIEFASGVFDLRRIHIADVESISAGAQSVIMGSLSDLDLIASTGATAMFWLMGAGGSREFAASGLTLDASLATSAIQVITHGQGVSVTGTSQADTLTADGWDSALDGGRGNDTITAQNGDTLLGGDGDDTLYWHERGYSGFRGLIDGGAGTDTLHVLATPDPNFGYRESLVVKGIEIIVGSNLRIDLDNFDSVQKIAKPIGDDGDRLVLQLLNGTASFARIDVSDFDSIWYSVGPYDGEGTIHFTASDRAERFGINGNQGGTVHASGGDDTIGGSFGGRQLTGGTGDDDISLLGGAWGQGWISGDDGNDTIWVDLYEFNGAIWGGSGDDKITVSTWKSRCTVDGGSGHDVLETYGEVQDLTFTNIERLEVVWLTVTIQQLATFDEIARPVWSSDKLDLDLSGTGGTLDLSKSVVVGVRVDISGETLSSALDLRASRGNDDLTGSAFDDTLNGANGDDVITAGNGDDRLDGGRGLDVLHGGQGNDTMIAWDGPDELDGGAGDDVYVVKSAGGVVMEAADAGRDTVRTDRAAYTLGDNLEALELLHATGARGVGNTLDNTIRGGLGHDTLIGGLGHDRLQGRAGDDRLEGWGGADTLLGGDGNDSLRGGRGDDVLSGGRGLDMLTGGTGDDVFVLAAPRGGTNVATITDFSVADDTIRLDATIYGTLAAGAIADDALLVRGPGHEAEMTDRTRLIYDSGTGALSYDRDGAGGGGPVVIARLATGLALTADDFIVA